MKKFLSLFVVMAMLISCIVPVSAETADEGAVVVEETPYPLTTELPNRVVTVTASASVESGVVPYGTLVFLRSSAHLWYSINGGEPIFSWDSVMLMITEDTTVTVSASVDAIEPGVTYECPEMTYTYVVDPSVTAEPLPTLKPALNDGNFYGTKSDGKAIIYACNGELSGNVTVPSVINDFVVVGIRGDVFIDCENLTSVILPDTLESIGNLVFADCSFLKSVTVPVSVTKIGTTAFDGLSEDFVMYGYSGSYAQTYAEENGITFVDITSPCYEIVTVPAPVASVESGKVPYGQLVTIENNSGIGTLMYSFYGNSWIEADSPLKLIIGDETTVSVKVSVPYPEPNKEYFCEEATYTYTIDDSLESPRNEYEEKYNVSYYNGGIGNEYADDVVEPYGNRISSVGGLSLLWIRRPEYLAAVKEKYDEEFFKDNFLVVVSWEQSHGARDRYLEKVEIEENDVNIVMGEAFYCGSSTTAFESFCAIVEIPKSENGKALELNGKYFYVPPLCIEPIYVPAPDVDAESGMVAFGTEITISPVYDNSVEYSVEYSINGSEFAYAEGTVILSITEDTELVVRSRVNNPDPDAVYMIDKSVYTYTIDQTTMATPHPFPIYVNAPDVDTESGTVAYGTEITISPVKNNGIEYSINGSEFVYEKEAVKISITKNAELVVKSRVDNPDPDPNARYMIDEHIYMYTIDPSTIPVDGKYEVTFENLNYMSVYTDLSMSEIAEAPYKTTDGKVYFFVGIPDGGGELTLISSNGTLEKLGEMEDVQGVYGYKYVLSDVTEDTIVTANWHNGPFIDLDVIRNEDGTVTAEVRAGYANAAPAIGVVILAVYEEDGSLHSLNSVDAINYSHTFDLTEVPANATFKAMWWDSVCGMQPIIEAAIETVPNSEVVAPIDAEI